jgi:hypothetical protein
VLFVASEIRQRTRRRRKAQVNWGAVQALAAERYRSRYLELAARVPEFAIWAQLGEHAATRTAIRELGATVTGSVAGLGATLLKLNADVVGGFNANRDALNRVEALLSAGLRGTVDDSGASAAGPRQGLFGLRQALSRANRAAPRILQLLAMIPDRCVLRLSPRVPRRRFAAPALGDRRGGRCF